MNRADLLYSVLRDGKPHSRRDIFERVGYMLTNNSASELRARGFDVQHSREGRVDVYLLVRGRGDGQASAPSNEQSDPPVSRSGCSPFSAPERRWEPPGEVVTGAAGVAHASDGAGAENNSGDTSASRAVTYAAGNELHPSASPEQLSLEAA